MGYNPNLNIRLNANTSAPSDQTLDSMKIGLLEEYLGGKDQTSGDIAMLRALSIKKLLNVNKSNVICEAGKEAICVTAKFTLE